MASLNFVSCDLCDKYLAVKKALNKKSGHRIVLTPAGVLYKTLKTLLCFEVFVELELIREPDLFPGNFSFCYA